MSDFDGKIEMEKFSPSYRLMIKYTELENRIDKAIGYIKKVSNNGMFELRMEEIEEVLDILKGGDRDENR